MQPTVSSLVRTGVCGLGLFAGCVTPPADAEPTTPTSSPAEPTDPESTSASTEPPVVPTRGGVAVLSGLALTELTWVSGPGERCGEEPPLRLSDLDGDGIPEVALACEPSGSNGLRVEEHVLDGAALVGGVAAVEAVIAGRGSGSSVLGDLDGDGLDELGFGAGLQTLNGSSDLTWWYVRPGATLASSTPRTDAWGLDGLGDQYGGGPPLPGGDGDGDGVPDVVVWQMPGSEDPVVYVVSGATLGGAARAVPGDALRALTGLARDEEPTDAVPVGDLDGDGLDDLAVHVGGPGPQYYGSAPTAVEVAWGPDFAGRLRIAGSWAGRDRYGYLDYLGDLDGDGQGELAILFATTTSSEDYTAELVVVPGAALAAGQDLQAVTYALGGLTGEPRFLAACDLDGDGLPELIVGGDDGGVWDGRTLLVPGSLPVGPAPGGAPSCVGDLDGTPGAELLVGRPNVL